MSVAQFIEAALRADPTLAGSTEKDGAEIAKLSDETESIAVDLSVSAFCPSSGISPDLSVPRGATDTAYLPTLECPIYRGCQLVLPSTPFNGAPDFTVAPGDPLKPQIKAPSSQHPTHPSILRYFLHIQSLPPVESAQKSLPNSFPPVSVDVTSLPPADRKAVAPVAKPKKEKKSTPPAGVVETAVAGASAAATAVSAAAVAASATVASGVEAVKEAVVGAPNGSDAKKEKKPKEKKDKPAPIVKEDTGPMPSMIDMRVGKVLEGERSHCCSDRLRSSVKRHPDADSLYVEMIDVGELEPRQVCSGLVKYMSEDEIRGATIIVIVS